MGFSASWIAVQGLAPEVAIEALGLEVVSEGNPYPEGEISLAALANGWTVVWFERDLEAVFTAPGHALAQHGPTVACAVEEHVMFSEARGYADGAETWRVAWDCEEDRNEPATSGDVPAAYAAILAQAVAEQAKPGNEIVDFLWDVPPELAESICGFRHDKTVGDGSTFIELRRARGHSSRRQMTGEVRGQASGGFWRRLFGRR